MSRWDEPRFGQSRFDQPRFDAGRFGGNTGVGGGGGGAENFAVQSVVTETGTTPSVTAVTLGATQNAVRVFADLVAAAEPFFYLYVKRNSDSVQKVKIYAWSARIFSGAAGDAFAFSTSDGRTLSMAAQAVPAVLESSFPVTGTANADNGCPPYWAPAAAHITLAAAGSAFQLADTSTGEIVFIREFDGTQWTPTRWVRKQSGRATSIRCTYQQIAVATLDGATLSIAAPTGAVIGGTSTGMVNTFLPTVTGTTRNVTDVATLKTAIAAAVAGDEIVLATGTYALDVAITEISFTLNNGQNGKIGMEGILIRGATGNPADVVLTGDGTGTNGNWNVESGPALFAGFKDLSWDLAGKNMGLTTNHGRWALEDVNITGVQVTHPDAWLFDNVGGALTLEALRVSISDGFSDLFNGNGDASFNATSRARFVNCSGVRAGVGSADQCLTTHLGLPVEWYGGLLSDGNTNAAAPDGLSSPIYLPL